VVITLTIISHSKKFIFIKARKVASSSVLVALGQHCENLDIVTAPGNTEGYPRNKMNSEGIETHSHPSIIQSLITPEQWQNYTKITCVRNPWDMAVSLLLWQFHRRGARKPGTRKQMHVYSPSFEKMIRSQNIDTTDPEYRECFSRVYSVLSKNCYFYFDEAGSPQADIFLRFENLQSEYDELCDRLNLPRTLLPLLKSRFRKKEWIYQNFYDEELIDNVYRASSPIVDYFNYKF
jgi:hypothetical protein